MSVPPASPASPCAPPPPRRSPFKVAEHGPERPFAFTFQLDELSTSYLMGFAMSLAVELSFQGLLFEFLLLGCKRIWPVILFLNKSRIFTDGTHRSWRSQCRTWEHSNDHQDAQDSQ
jgi:hypothetical protein